MQSEHINEIATALSKAQSEIGDAKLNSANPFFKSKYADLSSVWDACREPLTKNNLAVTQVVETEGGSSVLQTILVHSSGQWVKSTLPILCDKNTPQSFGSAITYLRRYSLAAIVGVAPEDDDAEAASNHGAENVKTKTLDRDGQGTAKAAATPPPVKTAVYPEANSIFEQLVARIAAAQNVGQIKGVKYDAEANLKSKRLTQDQYQSIMIACEKSNFAAPHAIGA